MNDHLQALLDGRQYSEELKEQAVIRVIFGGEDPHETIRIMDIHSVYTLNGWVVSYRKKIEGGLITLPPMTEKATSGSAGASPKGQRAGTGLKGCTPLNF